MMKAAIQCQINGIFVMITNNAVRTTNQNLQIELVKRLIECKSQVKIGESVLPHFFNTYLRFYELDWFKFEDSSMELNLPNIPTPRAIAA